MSIVRPRTRGLGGAVAMVTERPQLDGLVLAGGQEEVFAVLHVQRTHRAAVTCENESVLQLEASEQVT